LHHAPVVGSAGFGHAVANSWLTADVIEVATHPGVSVKGTMVASTSEY